MHNTILKLHDSQAMNFNLHTFIIGLILTEPVIIERRNCSVEYIRTGVIMSKACKCVCHFGGYAFSLHD